LAHKNLLQLVSHHGTESVGDVGLLFRNKILRRVGIIVVNGTRSVFLSYVRRSSHFWTNLALVSHSPVTISSRPARCLPAPELQHCFSHSKKVSGLL